ncbi:hypothetical protein FRC14_004962 [Serendipita sp. 396]|nr:hypothetical protein FRC14_004962 [Serendipita sp. 396]KAG8787139.1 hypothetical protein FRC15_009884 [Serendipita sp. 397]KAG8799940.1 hypothetical protein FRC18_008155 [Serendipita sp. 400]KAG8802665.1 hypothetical protein FRC16_009018 [Serendipita sp. 398]KAG8852724.1 hypothetical protein FRB91_006081 [Serendipita sp. 411]KAG8872366.1 hypothetical protein FRC20_009522 [Serendipita sp. 405]KAG9054169.1 hypothetical protein FS842_005893 [Serendipita sp. 407]
MPLFKSRTTTTDPAVADPVVNDVPPTRKGSIFSRRAAPAPVTTTNTAADPVTGSPTTTTTRRGLFGRRRSISSDSSLSDNSSRRARRNHAAAAGTTAGATTGFFGNKLRDPTLDAARGKVHAAELLEKEADKALVAARAAVAEARKHVAILEREANEQARLAQEKVLAARGVKSDAGHLGRHS